MADGHVEINSQMNNHDVINGIENIQDKLRGLTLSFLKTAAVSTAVTLSPSLIPMLATATVGAAGLAASFAAAGIGVAAFGAVAVGVLSQVFTAAEEVEKIEEKIAKADTAKEKLAAQKELAALYKGMSEDQRQALKDLQGFKEFWGDFIKQFEKPVFQSFSLSLTFVKNILNELEPTIKAVSGVFVTLLREVNGFGEDGGMKAFFEWLETNAAEALYNFAHIFGNVFQGIFNLLMAFSPIGAGMEEGLLSLSERFKEWSSSVGSSEGFKSFIEYVKENAPKVLEVIGSIIEVGKEIVIALAPLGSTVLEALSSIIGTLRDDIVPILSQVAEGANTVVSAIMDNWPAVKETVIGVSVAVGSFVAIMKGLQIIGIINTLMTAYRAGTLVATAAQIGLNLAMLANPITWIVALIALLIAAGVLLYRNWDKVKAKMSELWSAIKEKWNSLKDSIVTAVENIKEKMSSGFQAAKDKAVTIFGQVKEAIMTPIRAAVDFVKEQIEKIKGFFSGLKLKLPNIPLPHFSLSGKFSLTPPSVPKMKVNWYADGALFPANSPRLVGVGDNKSHQEAALPLSPKVLGMIGQKISDTMGGNGSSVDMAILLNAIEKIVNRPVMASIDGKQMVMVLAPHIDSVMESLTDDKNRWEGIL